MTPRRRVAVAVVAAIAAVILYAGAGAWGVADAGRASPTAADRAGLETATFAAGCFWCVEADFDKVPGVVATTSGYTGGHLANPTYGQVSSGGTGHVEAVQVLFDPAVVTYEQLLDHFWHHVDPFVSNRQFCDVGEQYRPEIFVRDAAQRMAALASRERVQRQFSAPILVQVSDAGPFFAAEAYHQDYYRKNPIGYRFYRWSCGRDARVAAIWDE